VFYLFTKKRYGFVAALMSLALLVSFAPFYGNGRPVQGEVAGLVFLVLGALCLLYWEEHNFKSKEWALSSGLALGLAAATKPIYLIVLSAALVVTLLLCFKRFQDKRDLLIAVAGFLLPILLWLVMTFPTIDHMIKGFSTYFFLSGNHNSGLSGMETVRQNSLRFFTESTPILFLILFLTTAVSFALRYFKKTPAGVAFTSTHAGQGTGCNESGGTVTCELGNLANGADATMTLVTSVVASPPGAISNTVTVTANESDPNLANNTVLAVTALRPPHDG
jgi:4-amino-4-deoxy-L-arabinose transferase-like glycosyltransferase